MRLAIALLFLAIGLCLTVTAGREIAEFGRAGPAEVLIQVGILVLPVVALAAIFRFRIEALAGASVAWPLVLLWAFPRWTPLPPGPPAPPQVARQAPAPAPPAPAPKAPAPATTVSAPPVPPFHLAIHGAGMNPRVPVHLQGRHETIWLHLDTGASLTVISAQDLAKLGIELPAGSPEVTFHLANNAPDANPVMLIDRLEVGGFEVEGVTVAVCTNCMELLGMNVLSQLHLSVDPEAGELLCRS